MDESSLRATFEPKPAESMQREKSEQPTCQKSWAWYLLRVAGRIEEYIEPGSGLLGGVCSLSTL